MREHLLLGGLMAYCDRCGNFDESHREEMEYPKDGQIVYRTTNLIATTIGIPRWRRIMIGELQYRMRIAYVKSVLTF